MEKRSVLEQKNDCTAVSQPEETVWESAFQVEGNRKVPNFSPPLAVDILK